MSFAGPAGKTETPHILISVITINPGFPYLYPKISMFSFGISYLLQFAKGKLHSHVRIIVIFMIICRPGGLRSFCTSRFLLKEFFLDLCEISSIAVLTVFMTPAQLGACRILFLWEEFGDNSVMGSYHSINLKQLWLRAPITGKDYERSVYRSLKGPTQANLSEIARYHHGDKVTNKWIF